MVPVVIGVTLLALFTIQELRFNGEPAIDLRLFRDRSFSVSSGLLLLTSRASYEMIQKSAAVGITFLVALSAPTALAVRLAERAGMTLVAFARERQHVVYAHPRRVSEGA